MNSSERVSNLIDEEKEVYLKKVSPPFKNKGKHKGLARWIWQTDSLEKLKQTLDYRWEILVEQFESEGNFNLSHARSDFLKDVLKTTEKWMELGREPQFNRNQIRMFQDYLNTELDKANGSLPYRLETLKQYALFLYYKGKMVTRHNAKDFLKGTKRESGEKLYQHFTKFSERSERIGNPGSEIKLKNRIKDLEKVIGALPEEKSKQAKEELKELKKHQI